MSNISPRFSVRAAIAAGALFLVTAGTVRSQTDWDPETVATAAHIAVQDGGRVKPLSTVARVRLIRYSGGTSLKIEDEATKKTRRLKPTEWMLDCLFFPERAKRYPTFLVARFDVIDAIQIRHEGKKKRDRYSYADLEEGISRLYELARQYEPIEAKKRTAVQEQILRLAGSVNDFSRLVASFAPVREAWDVGKVDRVAALFGGPKKVPLSELLSKASGIMTLYRESGDDKDPALARLVSRLVSYGDWAGTIAFFPPEAGTGENEAWLSLGDLISRSLRGRTQGLDKQYAQLGRLEKLVAARADQATFGPEIGALQQELQGLAEARGQYDKVPLEVSYYAKNHLFWAKWLYVVCFFLVAIGWLVPRSKVLDWVSWGALLVPTTFLILAIWDRCVIRDRPPVTTLYETILFVTAVIAVTLLVIELMTRWRVAVSATALLGAAGLFLAQRFELAEGVDTMPTLLAVLDTNFWLTTHVLTVTAGYAASLLAAALAHVWLFGTGFSFLGQKLLGRTAGPPAFYQVVARMTYGVVLFGLLFSLIGTILGGIWANDSWGRFWGWDPKENGALMICLWQLAILHARLGGYIRPFGLAMMTIGLGMITVFSWWHVNQLGVGLHAYGFTDGILKNLWFFYKIETVILGVALLGWIIARVVKGGSKPAGGEPAMTVQAPEE